MQKNYFIKASLTLFLLFGAMLVNAQIEFALREGFESGVVPATWTQEHVVGNTSWMVERGGTMPVGAAEGNYRIALRNTTQQTQGFVTKLITPVMDLSQVFQPILVFSYAQNHNLGDVDELRVFYRRGENEPWILLREYITRVPFWQTATIPLPAQSATYQVAFEGTDRFGRGIVLDNVQVRPMPTCDQPHITTVSEVSSTSLRLHWIGSFDSDAFVLRVSTVPLDDVENADITELLVDTIIHAFSCFLENLEINTVYFAYVKSICSDEESVWSDAFVFRTQATITLPYHQNFNMELNPGIISRPATWIYGTSWPTTPISPFVNTATSAGTRGNFSRDHTTVLVMGRANNVTTVGHVDNRIPAGAWVYAASPEIVVDDMSKVQVSFWATAHTHVGADLASSIIVGIMSDPTDITTFVPIDTAVITALSHFEEFIIPFDGYTGAGRYVAFLSNFDRDNIIFIDDVVIELTPSCRKIQNVRAARVGHNSASFTWNASVGAQAYEIIVSTALLTNPSLGNDTVVFSQTGILTNSVTVTGLTPETQYFIYVRAACVGVDRGAWSNVISMVTTCAPFSAIPHTFTFGEGPHTRIPGSQLASQLIAPCYITRFEVTTTPIHITTTAASRRTGTHGLRVTGRNPLHRTHFAFPPIPDGVDMADLRVVFEARAGAQADIDNNRNSIEIGVMTNHDDHNSFVPIDTVFARTTTWIAYSVNFSSYTGEGRIIAIRPSALNTSTTATTVDIDAVLVELIPDDYCAMPRGVTVVPGATTAQFDWSATGAAQYQVRLLHVVNNVRVVAIDTIVDTNSFLATELLPNLVTYFYQVRAVCYEDNFSEWTWEASFRTLCVPASVPFFEGFDGQGYPTTGDLSIHPNAPRCWTFLTAIRTIGGGFTPSIGAQTTLFPENSVAMTMMSDGSVIHPQMAVLPKFDVPIQELFLSFLIGHTSHDQNPFMEIGVITDDDFESFELIQRIDGLQRNVAREFIINFSEYTGNGNRIAFHRPAVSGGTSMSIDNITVDRLGCMPPQNLRALDVNFGGARLLWNPGEDETQWEVLVVQTDAVVNPETVTANIVLRDTISGNPTVTLTGLGSNLPHTFFVRSICDNRASVWAAGSRFRTTCEPVTVGQLGGQAWAGTPAVPGIPGTYRFDNYNATASVAFASSCWEMGRLFGPHVVGSTQPRLMFGENPNGTNRSRRSLNIQESTTQNGTFAIMPAIDIDSINRLQLSFRMAAMNNTVATAVNGIIVGVVTSPADIGSFVPIDTVFSPITPNTSGSQAEFLDFVVSFADYQGDFDGNFGTRVMFLSLFGDEYGTSNNVLINDVRLDTIGICPQPTRVRISDITHESAIISWLGDATADYQVLISRTRLPADSLSSPHLALNPEVHVLASVTGTSYTTTGLGILEIYFVYVRQVCSETETGRWSLVEDFRTICPPSFPLPFFENFDTYVAEGTQWISATLPCWNRFNGTPGALATTLMPAVSRAAGNNFTRGGVGGLNFSLTASAVDHYMMAISPAIAVEDISKTTLTFYTRNANVTSRPKLVVGVTAHPDSLTLSSFTPIDTICNAAIFGATTTAWFRHTYDLSSLANSANVLNYKHLVFAMVRALNENNADSLVAGQTGQIIIDDIELILTPTCARPAWVHTRRVMGSTAEIFWTMDENTAATSWEVQYGLAGFELGTGNIVQVDTSFVQLTGLTPDTEHDVYVRSYCGNVDFSRWTVPISFTTYCLIDANTAFFGFEVSEGRIPNPIPNRNPIPRCWMWMANVPESNSLIPILRPNTTAAASGQTFAKTGTVALELLVSAPTVPYSFAVLPELAGDFDTLQINFSARSVATGAQTRTIVADRGRVVVNETAAPRNPHVIVGAMTDPGDWSTFERIAVVPLSRWTTTDVESPANNFLWDDISVPLNGVGQGKYIAFALSASRANVVGLHRLWIDDVWFSAETACAIPDNIRLENLNAESTVGDLVWNVLGTRNTAWEVKMEDLSLDSVIFLGTVTVPNITGLAITPQTTYRVSVRAICDGDESRWNIIEIRTPCAPNLVEHVWNFATAHGVPNVLEGSNLNSFLAPECWVVGNINAPATQARIPHIARDGSNQFASSTAGPSIPGTSANRNFGRGPFGTGAVLYFDINNQTPSNNGAYAIMPPVAGDLDTLQLRFYARSGILSNVVTPGRGYLVNSGSVGPRSIIVGTVTDQHDISTFVPIDTIRVRQNLVTLGDGQQAGNEENNWLFEEFVIPLVGAAGRYVTFLSNFPVSNGQNRMLLSDITIEPLGPCLTPINLSASDITSTSVTLSYLPLGSGAVAGLGWTAMLAKTTESDSVVHEIKVDTFRPIEITGLLPGTEYIAVVKQHCEGDAVTDFSEPITFRTAHVVPYLYDFSVVRHEPVGWGRFGGAFPESGVISTSSLSRQLESAVNPQFNWVHSGAIGLRTPHQRVTLGWGLRNIWMVTPLIELPAEDVWLTFDLALTAVNSALPPPNLPDGENDKLKVIVSVDGGLTWNLDNATVWANDDTGDYVFDAIPARGERAFVDLSQYAGKSIRIAFLAHTSGRANNSEATSRWVDLRVGNVSVNHVAKVLHQEEMCFGNDFFGHGFFVDFEEMKLGENTFNRISLSPGSVAADSLISVAINVTPMAEHTIHASICEGETFELYGFVADRAGVFKRKLTSHLGCDSVVVLNLSVMQTIRRDYVETICQGQSIWFDGEELTRSGVFTATFESLVTGCDSIVTLFLTVRDAIKTTLNEVVCFGGSFTWNGNVFTESGSFEEAFLTPAGCDSIVTLNLTVMSEIVPTIIYGFTCPGVPFTDVENGFINIPPVANDYEILRQTAFGCDSLVILRLTVLHADTVFVNETITTDQLPFTFHGRHFPVGTPTGVYSDTTFVSDGTGDCESVLIVTLTIDDGVGFQTITVHGLTIIPTIINRGDFVQIIAPEDMGDLEIEVYDMSGQRIFWQQPTPLPIRIDAFPASGTYVIRAISKNGKVMHGRIIVR